MKFVIFASDLVGKETIGFLSEIKQPLEGLVLDGRDPGSYNEEIIKLYRTANPAGEIAYSDNAENVVSLVTRSEPDLLILAWWGYILRESVLSLPKLGTLNFHPSYLPYNRGKHYNFWTLVEDTPFGVSIHWVDAGVDSGDIAFQSRIEKSWEDTGKSLYEKAQAAMVALFKRSFRDILKGAIPRIPQDLSLGSFHRAKELNDASRLDLTREYRACDLLNLIRARTFKPHPGAWFSTEEGEKFEVRIEISRID